MKLSRLASLYDSPQKAAWVIVIPYLILGSSWILWSDQLAFAMFEGTDTYRLVQTGKGWFYVLVTGLLLFFLIRGVTGQLFLSQKKTQDQADYNQLLFNTSPVGLSLSDLNGKYVDVNPAFSQLIGRPSEDIIGKTFVELVPETDPDEYRRRGDLILREGYHGPYEKKLTRPDGNVRYLRCFSRRIEIAGEKMIWSSAEDISDRQAQEEELTQANRELEELSRMKSSFLRNMSHEVRTPLSGIIGYASLIEEDSSEEHRDFARQIRQCGERLLASFKNVLDFARLDIDDYSIQSEEVDLARFVCDAASSFRAEAREKGISFHIRNCDRPVYVRSDTYCLKRILQNILSNSLKFTDEGAVDISLAHDDDTFTIAVSDTGLGMDPAFHAEAFEEFSQESTGISRSYEGNGLGLTIVKRMVDILQGSVELSGEKGSGTTVTLRLPKRANRTRDIGPAVSASSSGFGSRRV